MTMYAGKAKNQDNKSIIYRILDTITEFLCVLGFSLFTIYLMVEWATR